MSSHDPALSSLFQALADPTRRGIVERLARGPATVGELAGPVPAALPTVLAHLRKLEAAGLVRSRKDGRVRTCTLVPQALAPAQDWLARQRAEWEARLDRLETYLNALQQDRSDGP